MPVFMSRAEKRDARRLAVDGGPGSGPRSGGGGKKKSVRERFEGPEYKERHNPQFVEPNLPLKGGSDDRWASALRSHATMLRRDARRAISDEPPTSAPLFVIIGDAAPETLTSPGTPGFMLFDNLTIDEAAKVKITPDGYLTACPRVAKVGIQTYHGDECGKPEMATVRVYRPPETVFDKTSMHSFAHKPVTLNHPDVRVTADNWKAVAVGHIGDEVARDGESIRVPMVLMDAKAIKAYKDGHRQLSMGYTCDLEWTAGETSDGQKYDAIQRNVHPNHLAVVPAARGGPTLCLGDSNSQEKTMNATTTLKSVMVDGIQCEMTDTASAIVNRTITGLQSQLDAWKKKDKERDDDDEKEECENDAAMKAKDVKIAELETVIKTKDAEIATVKKQVTDAAVTPAQLDAMVRDRQGVTEVCRKVFGDRWTMDGKTIDQARREVVDKQMGDISKGWNELQVQTSFDTLKPTIMGKGAVGGTGGTVNDAVVAFAGKPGVGYQQFDAGESAKAQAYNDMVYDMTNAWKPKEVQDAERALRDAQRRSGH